MSDSDPSLFVSNGTCYTAPGQKLDGSFIPCGNDAFGHQTCCGAKDNCIADGACFGVHGTGYGSFLTYFAGCTDPDYKDPSCPKKVVDQPWVALTLCDNSNGEWAICSQSGNPSTLQPGSYCSCTVASSATVAFSDSTSLTNICSLPQSTGQTISFDAGHTPTSPAAGSAAPTQNSGSTTADDSSSNAPSSAGVTSVPTSSILTVYTSSGKAITSLIAPSTTPSPSGTGAAGSNTKSSSDSTSSGLSSGAKIGIGVGAALGALLLLAILAAFLLLRRRRQKRATPKVDNAVADGDTDTKTSKPGSKDGHPVVAAATSPTVPEADGQPLSEADGRGAPPWTLRSELEGSRVKRADALTPVAELPGSENFAGEQGPGTTLTQEAHRQLGPEWRDALRE